MKSASLIPALVAAWVAGVPMQSAASVNFPIEYSGHYHLTVNLKNEFGTGSCTNLAALSITLLADGQLVWKIEELEAFLQTPSKQPPTCDIRASGRTNTLAGTHDGVSEYSVPSGNPSFPPITGSFTFERLTGEYRAGGSLITFDLPVATPHRIAIEPDPSKGFDFQMSILQGRGFKIVMSDPHGRDHLDLATFKILVGGSSTSPGTDTTQYALNKLLKGVVALSEESSDSLTRVFKIVPDPKKLMQDPAFPKDSNLAHDIFAIPFNGDWRIELRICDKANTCFNAAYTVYFGPFVMIPSVVNVTDDRCAMPPVDVLRITSVTVGNIGIDSPKTAIYVGLVGSGQAGLWTFYFDDFGDGTGRFAWWQGSLLPMLPEMSIPSGTLLVEREIVLQDYIAVPAGGTGAPWQRRIPFPDGTYTFVTAAVDTGTGALRRDEHEVAMCYK